MIAAAIATTLLACGLIDGGFAGFRASLGRTGLIHHRVENLRSALRGAATGCVLLAPAIGTVSTDSAINPERLSTYATAGLAMLWVYLPYACVMLTAIAAYATLPWRLKFLSTSLVMGPMSLLRPAVAIAGGVAATWVTLDMRVATASALAVMAVLAVEPLVGKRWYSRPRPAAGTQDLPVVHGPVGQAIDR